MRFADRHDAGRRLGERVRELRLDDPVVLALPRGGVPVAYEVARELAAPLDVLVVRKIGAPFQPELGVGAIAEGDVTVYDRQTLAALHLTVDDLAETVRRERAELDRRVGRYRGQRVPLPIEGRSVVVVDDGLATGVSARAALRSVRQRGPVHLVLAVPVGPPNAADFMVPDADEVVMVEAPQRLSAVGQWYDDFTQTSDDTVVTLLDAAGNPG